MCRNIKTLFNFDPPVTAEEARAAALQFVRKISGFNKPSKPNEAAFLAAVEAITAIAERLLHTLKRTPLQGTESKRLPKQNCGPPNGSVPSNGLREFDVRVVPKRLSSPDQMEIT